MRKLRFRPTQIATTVSAAVALAATATGLIFTLWPTARPEDRPASTRADFTNNITVDHISFAQYLQYIGQSRSGWRRKALRRQGVLVRYIVNIKGYRDKLLPLRWRLIDARTGDQVGHSPRGQFLAAETSDDQAGWPIWVPVPRGRERRFFVDIELLDDRGGGLLGQRRTRPFAGT